MSSLVLPENHPHKDGRICTTCGVFKTVEHFKLEKDSRAFGGITMRSKCRPCEEHRKWKKFIVKRYGITHEEYYEMLAQQNNGCKICGSTDNNNERCESNRLFIDHCHKTNKVRGLLCSKCNHGLGQFNDDIDRLQKAIEYLKQFERKT